MILPLVWIAVMAAISVLHAEGVRRLPPRLALALFAAAPVVATPVWLAQGAPWFSVVKVYSVCAAMLLLLVLKATRWAEHPSGRWAAYGLLALNILEAVAADAKETSLLNAATGVLLVLALRYPGGLRVEGRDLRYDLGLGWVAAYSLWNFAFVYGNRPGFAAFALVHVGVPLLACRLNASLWIQARVAILTLLMILRMTAPEPPFVVLVPEWQVPAVAQALHAAAFLLMLGTVWRARRTPCLVGSLASALKPT